MSGMNGMSAPCPCGCAVAAWSMPWPVTSAGVAPWAPEAMHQAWRRAPAGNRDDRALFVADEDRDVTGSRYIGPPDDQLIDTDLLEDDLPNGTHDQPNQTPGAHRDRRTA
jgi:hypothetical protein